MPLNLFYTMVQKSQKWPKTQIKGGGPALNRDEYILLDANSQKKRWRSEVQAADFSPIQAGCSWATRSSKRELAVLIVWVFIVVWCIFYVWLFLLFQVAGPPGCGKTQFCIQMSVQATLPVELGGSGGAAVYIDTESAFTAQR